MQKVNEVLVLLALLAITGTALLVAGITAVAFFEYTSQHCY
jgi:hypothetical protein